MLNRLPFFNVRGSLSGMSFLEVVSLVFKSPN